MSWISACLRPCTHYDNKEDRDGKTKKTNELARQRIKNKGRDSKPKTIKTRSITRWRLKNDELDAVKRG
jgi:hypothetical protein